MDLTPSDRKGKLSWAKSQAFGWLGPLLAFLPSSPPKGQPLGAQYCLGGNIHVGQWEYFRAQQVNWGWAPQPTSGEL